MADGVETMILEVNDPVEFLEYIGAKDPFCRIQYFFSLGHAYQYGITLKHMTGTPDDPVLQAKMRQLYGADIVFGSNDFTEFQTHQFRVSNMRFLPSGMVKTLRSVFRQAKGIFILGCNAGNVQDAVDNTFCEEFASLLDKPVFGAGYYSKVFEFDGTKWNPVDIHREDPITGGRQYVLAPNERGTFQFFKYVKDHGLPEHFHPSEASDLFEFYKESMELLFPNPGFDHQSGQSVGDPDLQEPDDE
jgi:hypothetical protein